jgi:hypothetical protein
MDLHVYFPVRLHGAVLNYLGKGIFLLLPHDDIITPFLFFSKEKSSLMYIFGGHPVAWTV